MSLKKALEKVLKDERTKRMALEDFARDIIAYAYIPDMDETEYTVHIDADVYNRWKKELFRSETQ